MSTDTIQATESVKVKRDYLTEREVDQLVLAARSGRHGLRDALLLLMMYRHGLRSCEAIDLTWDQIDLTAGTVLVHRAKAGAASTQPLSGAEIRSLRVLKKAQKSPYVFTSERGSKMTTQNVRMLFKKLRDSDVLPTCAPIHAHALRHGCGHKLADQGIDTRRIQDYLGHKSIQNTQRYTQLSAAKFKNFDKLI